MKASILLVTIILLIPFVSANGQIAELQSSPSLTPTPTPEEMPYCDEVPDGSGDSVPVCHDRTDVSETTGLYPCLDGSEEKDWRDCKHGTGHEDHTSESTSETSTSTSETSETETGSVSRPEAIPLCTDLEPLELFSTICITSLGQLVDIRIALGLEPGSGSGFNDNGGGPMLFGSDSSIPIPNDNDNDNDDSGGSSSSTSETRTETETETETEITIDDGTGTGTEIITEDD
jgi:hypothetical protein